MTSTQPQPPGPSSTFGLRSIMRLSRDSLGFLRGLADEYGDVVKLTMAGKPFYILHHPDHIEAALVKHARMMGRDAYVETLERTLGLGLLTSEGDLWKRQRKLMAQAFSPKRIASYAETMVEVGDQGLPWRDGEVVNLHDEMSRLTMEVVAKVLFGTGVSPDDVRTVHDSMETVAAFYANSFEAMARIPAWVPTPGNLRLRPAVKRIDGIIYRIIEERRRLPADERGGDLLGRLVSACDEGGQGMSDQQLRDEAITLFLAGHETTALALGHTLTLIAKHPEIERKLVAELDDKLGGRLPSMSDVKQLTYTEQVIKEGMRLYPPAWTTGREALEDVEIGGYPIVKGSQIWMSQWITQRDPRWFPNPEAFDPDRFAPERAEQLPRFAYFPFGGGPRVCIGNHFAMMEAILLLAMVMQRYHLELLPGQRLELVPSVTLRAKQGMRVRVSQRRAASGGVAVTTPGSSPSPIDTAASTQPHA